MLVAHAVVVALVVIIIGVTIALMVTWVRLEDLQYEVESMPASRLVLTPVEMSLITHVRRAVAQGHSIRITRG